MNEFLDKNDQFDLNHEIKNEWWKILKAKTDKNKLVIQVCYLIKQFSTLLQMKFKWEIKSLALK